MNRSEAELMAANLHAKGDTFYHAEMYTTAYVQFTNSIQFLKRCSSNSKENLKILFAKRSLTCLKMGNYKKCLEDAQCALKLQEDGDDSLNELIRIRKVIIENVLKTDLLLSSIPEDEEVVDMSIDADSSTMFEFDEDLIMKEPKSEKAVEINNNSDGDLDKSATLQELLDECDDEEEVTEITIQTVMQHLSIIDDDDECNSDDSDSTLTDSTLINTDFGETESSYLSEEE